jgi:hypothetical protein
VAGAKNMIIEDAKGNTISNISEWKKIYASPRSEHQWRVGRSAQSVAEFVLNHDGTQRLAEKISEALTQPVIFEKAVPEFEVRFDEFGHGRMHDLAITGRVGESQRLFVGVEAKVDEPFGEIVRESYLRAKTRQISGKSTNAPRRIEGLLKMHFSNDDPKMFDVRYQLLYATAGTVAAGADISVLYVVVFRTKLYDPVKGAENYRDYLDFMTKVGAEPMKLSDGSVQGHQLSINGKELLCLYETIDL